MTARWIVRPEWRGSQKAGWLTLTADCCFEVDGVQYWIPEGYESDGASIPAGFGLLWFICGTPFDPDNCEAGIAHDSLYLTRVLPRPAADEVLCLLKQEYERWQGTKSWLSRFYGKRMWAGVRAFGYFAYQNNDSDKKELARIRESIIKRPDCDKFKSLWFASK